MNEITITKAEAEAAWKKSVDILNGLFDEVNAAKEEAVRASLWADKDPARAAVALSRLRAVQALYKKAERDEWDTGNAAARLDRAVA